MKASFWPRLSSRSSTGIIALATATGLACHQGPAPTSSRQLSGPAAAVQTTTHKGVGTITSVDLKLPSIEIDHEEIKGLMPAMTMRFYVPDKSLLQELRAGDRIEFTVERGVEGLKITAIKKL